MPAGSGAREEEGGTRLHRTWSLTCHLCFLKKQKSAREKRDNTQRQLCSAPHLPSPPPSEPRAGSLLTWRRKLLTVGTRTTF